MDHVDIERAFALCFAQEYRTRLCGGAAEPFYTGFGDDDSATLHYREDFPASALHETAHWCIAGTARRQLPDFGYAYTPPPRTPSEQSAFFRLERRVQALESIFADAAVIPFRISVDNLALSAYDHSQFLSSVRAEKESVTSWLATAGGRRALCFKKQLESARERTG